MKKTVLSLSLLAALLMIPAPGPDLVHNTLHAENKKIILLNADTVEGGETVS